MGFDSLFLTQVTQALQAKFGLKITFRQLLDRESTLDALAAFVDARLPADAFPLPPACPTAADVSVQPRIAEMNGQETRSSAAATIPIASTVATAPLAPAGSSAVEAIVREQLQAMSQLMSKQLDVLRGAGAAVDPGVAAALLPAAPQQASPPAQAHQMDGQTSRTIQPEGAERATTAQEFKPFGPYKPVQKGPVGELTERQLQLSRSPDQAIHHPHGSLQEVYSEPSRHPG